MDDGIADAEYEILDDPVADPPPPVSLDAPTTLVAFVNGQLAHWGVLLDGATWDQIEVAVAAVSAAQQTAGISSALVALRRAYGAAVIEVLPRWRLATGPAPAAWPTLPLAPIPAAGRAR